MSSLSDYPPGSPEAIAFVEGRARESEQASTVERIVRCRTLDEVAAWLDKYREYALAEEVRRMKG